MNAGRSDDDASMPVQDSAPNLEVTKTTFPTMTPKLGCDSLMPKIQGKNEYMCQLSILGAIQRLHITSEGANDSSNRQALFSRNVAIHFGAN